MSAARPGVPIADEALEAHAAELYPDDPTLQRQWVLAVRLVRTTAAGWLLDPLPLPRPAAPRGPVHVTTEERR